ncbi:MAG: TRAP transporter small permease subunit [Halieaceae bacterium]|nr:TRAP transporter small permease subunit [Halieaceae bacterium]
MQALRHFIRTVDHFTEQSGRWLAWLCLALALSVCLVVLLRYGLGTGSIALQESSTYLHALVFMLGAAYTLKHDGHVRVDIFYRRFSTRGKAWVNSVGCILFLLPFSVFVFAMSWPFVAEAWRILEGSPDPGGIHGVFLLKSLIPLMAVSLMLQGLAELARNALVLVGEE